MPNRIVDVVDALDAGVASGDDLAMNTDAETGARLPQQPDIRFVDAGVAFPMLVRENRPGTSA
jgi:hypothetical protein